MSNPIITLDTYNIYDRGYRGGAQTSIFIGPVWIEEAVSLRIGTGTSDRPVYPYSGVYYSRLLQGTYMVSGALTIAFTEADYLMKVIESARNESIQEEELYELIERRKSVFTDSVKYRMLAERAAQTTAEAEKRAYGYVNRITREIETTSVNGMYNPRDFELTIIRGDLYTDTKAIEIYQNVKINGTDSITAVDDTPHMEMYTFTAKRKPERKQRVVIDKPEGVFSLTNLAEAAMNIAEKLVEELFVPPSISVTQPAQRTLLMRNTDKLALGGLLAKNSWFHGKSAQFIEVNYAIEFPRTYSQVSYGSERKEFESTVPVAVYVNGTDVSGGTVKLVGPRFVSQDNSKIRGFDNSFGFLIAPHRYGCSKYFAAVSRVEPLTMYTPMGGSIVLPRFKRTDFEIGSFLPPKVLTNPDTFSFTDSDLGGLTMATLWTCLSGFRNSPSVYHPQSAISGHSTSRNRFAIYGRIANAESSGDKGTLKDMCLDAETQRFESGAIREVSQPVFSFALVDKFVFDSSTSTITMGEPHYADYMGIVQDTSDFGVNDPDNIIISFDSTGQVTGAVLKKAQTPVDVICNVTASVVELTDVFEYDVEGGVPRSWASGPPHDDAHKSGVLYQWLADEVVSVGPVAYSCLVSHVPSSSFAADASAWEELGEWYFPKFFTMSTAMDNARLTVDFDKCIYLRPLVFLDRNDASISTTTYNETEGRYECSYTPLPNPGTGLPAIATWFGTSAKDSSCDVDLTYIWVPKNISAYQQLGQSFTILGTYSLKPASSVRTVSVGGESVSWNDIYTPTGSKISPIKAYVYWVLLIAPVKRTNTPAKAVDPKVHVRVVSDENSRCGRRLELYNITRCDITGITGAKWSAYNPTDSTWQAIKNQLTIIFEQVLNLFTTTVYTYPVKTNLERIAGYMRGYAFSISISEIVQQVMECEFKDPGNVITGKVGSAPAWLTDYFDTGWTLHAAVSKAVDEPSLSTPNTITTTSVEQFYENIYSSVETYVKTRAKQKGMKVQDTIDFPGCLTIYKDAQPPAEATVAYGLSEDGYNFLKGIVTTSTTSILKRGGYSG